MQAGDLERHQAALEVDHRTIVHEHCEARVVTRSARQPCACGLWFCGQPKHFCSQARPPGRAQRGAVVKIHADDVSGAAVVGIVVHSENETSGSTAFLHCLFLLALELLHVAWSFREACRVKREECTSSVLLHRIRPATLR